MDDDIKVNKLSIILFIAFGILLVLFFIFITNRAKNVRSHVGRYISSADIDSSSIDALSDYGISTNGKYKYELILKNDDTFILYIDAISKLAYTGNYDKGVGKYTLKTYKLYDFDSNCYSRNLLQFKLKSSHKSLITSDITTKPLSFIKYDENVSKYDESINKITSSCGGLNEL